MLQQRVIYLDFLRIAATCAMIMLHVAGSFFLASDISSWEWAVGNTFDAVTRWCVPLFLMVSGCLFLGRDIPMRTMLGKYTLRLIVAFVVWSTAYHLTYHNEGDLVTRLNNLVRGEFHLWFIQMIIGIYLCMPVLRAIARDRKALLTFIAVSLLFIFVIQTMTDALSGGGRLSGVFIQLSNGAFGKIRAGLTASVYASYFLLGYYLHTTPLDKHKRHIVYAMGAVGFLATILLTHWFSLKRQHPLETFYYNGTWNVFLCATSIFVLFQSVIARYANRIGESGIYRRLIVPISNYSFGAYLVHVFFLRIVGSDIPMPGNPLFHIPLATTLIVGFSYAASALLHQIPVLKKYIV